jgi:hypothetical protein
MTMPFERTQAVLRTRDLLQQLAVSEHIDADTLRSAYCRYSGTILSPLTLTCRLQPSPRFGPVWVTSLKGRSAHPHRSSGRLKTLTGMLRIQQVVIPHT